MHNDLFSIGPLTVHGYGLMIGIGVILATFWAEKRAKARGLSEDLVLTLVILIVIFGFAGGKVLYTITVWRDFLANPWAVLGTEGFAVYGGIIVGVFTVWLCCRIKKADFLAYADVLLPPIALAQSLGRIGCFLAGCCYGAPTDSALGVVFPAGSIAPAGVRLLPTQLFSSAGDLALAVILALYSRRERQRGSVLWLYLLLYSVGRFVIEFFRGDPRGSVGVLSTSQFISIPVAAVMLVVYYVNLRKKRSHG